MKKVKRSGGRPPRKSVQNLIRNFERKNREEQAYSGDLAIERRVRRTVQRECPNLLPSEVEARVRRRIKRGGGNYLGPQ